MDQAGEAHAGHVARFGEHALEIPDRLLGLGEVLVEKAAAVVLRKEAVEAPLALGLGADIEQIDHEQVAGLGTLDADRAGQEVHDRQVDVAHVVGGIVVLDEAAGPVVGLDDEVVAGLHGRDHRDVRVPAVVHHVVVVGRLREIDLDQSLGHFLYSFTVRIFGSRPRCVSGMSPAAPVDRCCRSSFIRRGSAPDRFGRVAGAPRWWLSWRAAPSAPHPAP